MGTRRPKHGVAARRLLRRGANSGTKAAAAREVHRGGGFAGEKDAVATPRHSSLGGDLEREEQARA